jgi:hypothetical protein
MEKPIDKWLPRWSAFRGLAGSRLIRTSYFWFFFVPLVAKTIAPLNRVITIPLFDVTWRINLSLPFSWKIFYFSAVAFGIANAVLVLACPHIVKSYRVYAQFRDDGLGGSQVLKYFLDVWSSNGGKNMPHLNSFLSHCGRGDLVDAARAANWFQLYQLVGSLEIPQDRTGDAFFWVWTYSDIHNRLLRGLCAFFYAVGFSLFAVVLFQNLLAVIRLAST